MNEQMCQQQVARRIAMATPSAGRRPRGSTKANLSVACIFQCISAKKMQPKLSENVEQRRKR